MNAFLSSQPVEEFPRTADEHDSKPCGLQCAQPAGQNQAGLGMRNTDDD
jgi:hypothetical protein